jgi:hypothetical protein
MVFAGTTPVLGQYLLGATGSILAVVALGVWHVLITLFCALGLITRMHQEDACDMTREALAPQSGRELEPNTGRCWQRGSGPPAGSPRSIRLRRSGRRQGRSRSKPASTTTPLTAISATECCPT